MKKKNSRQDSLEEETQQETVEEESSSDDNEYAAQLEELQAQLDKEKAKSKNYKTALQRERSKKDQEEELEEVSQPKEDPSILEDRLKKLEELQDQKMADMRVELASQIFEEELSSLSSNPKEQELMREHYRSSIKSSGLTRSAIRKDLQLCKAAANMHRIQFGQDPEGAKGFTTAMSAGGAGRPPASEGQRPKLTEEEEKFLKKFGVDPKKVKL